MLEEYAALQTEVLAALRASLAEEEFGELALKIHRFQKRWNGPYAKFCGTREKASHWREIPAVPQSAFKSARLTVAPPQGITRTFRTSGTTGEGFGEHHFIDTKLYDAAVLAGWEKLGLPQLPQFIFVTAAHDAPHSSLAHMMAELARLAVEPFWMVDVRGHLRTDIHKALESVVRASHPVALHGTALAFLHLFEQLGAHRFHLPAGSYALETGGYKGSGREIPKAELYAMFGECLGLAPDDVINEYGMTELSSQFYTRGLGQPHEGPPWLRAVVIDPETGGEVAVGETGVLRIFDLANLGSVLAVETQDLAVRRERGFEMLGRDPAALPRGCSRAADERMRG